MTDKTLFDAVVVEITRGVTRFALGRGARDGARAVLGHYEKVRTGDFGSIRELIGHYVDLHGGVDKLPPVIAISHAGPQIGDKIIIPGCDLSFTEADIERDFGFERLVHANDCVALGSALPWLEASDVAKVSSREQTDFAHQPGRYALVVPTYGLGIASIIHSGETIQVIDSEGGHSNFAPPTGWHARFLAEQMEKGKQPTCDHIFSYPGLEAFYAYAAESTNTKAPDLRAPEILLYARNEADPLCLEALSRFCEALGAMAGDVALMLGSVDGVFLVSPFVNEVIEIGGNVEATIRKQFESKVDFDLYMQRIPLYTITHRRASMIGVLRLACDDTTQIAE